MSDLTDEDRVRQWLNDCDSVFRMSDRDWDRMAAQLEAARKAERDACWRRLQSLFEADPLAWSLVRRGLIRRAIAGESLGPREQEPADTAESNSEVKESK